MSFITTRHLVHELGIEKLLFMSSIAPLRRKQSFLCENKYLLLCETRRHSISCSKPELTFNDE